MRASLRGLLLLITTWRSRMVCLSLSAGIPGLELPEHEGLILSPHVQPLFGLFSSLLFSNHAQCLVHQYKLNISQIPARLHTSLSSSVFLCLSSFCGAPSIEQTRALAPPPRSSSSSSRRCAHHILCAAVLIIFVFAPPRSSSSSSRRRAHHLLCAAALITFLAPPRSSSSSRRRNHHASAP